MIGSLYVEFDRGKGREGTAFWRRTACGKDEELGNASSWLNKNGIHFGLRDNTKAYSGM